MPGGAALIWEDAGFAATFLKAAGAGFWLAAFGLPARAGLAFFGIETAPLAAGFFEDAGFAVFRGAAGCLETPPLAIVFPAAFRFGATSAFWRPEAPAGFLRAGSPADFLPAGLLGGFLRAEAPGGAFTSAGVARPGLALAMAFLP